MENTDTIYILLAAYNGEKYICQQVESILHQTYTNWKLFIRDDGSSDGTRKIINELTQQDKRIICINDENKNVGSVENFFTLLKHVLQEADYIMFADQDDVWQSNKIQVTIDAIKAAEKDFSPNEAILVYTNFTYVDERLNLIGSKKNYSATKISELQFSHLLAQNPAYGCTMMINNKLASLVKIIPGAIETFDHWLMLITSVFGKIVYIDERTVLYRQHSSNISGNYDNDSFNKRFQRIFLRGKNFQDVRLKLKMAEAFKTLYFDELNTKNRSVLNSFINFGKRNKLFSVFKNIANGVRRQTFNQTVLFYVSVLLLKKEKAQE